MLIVSFIFVTGVMAQEVDMKSKRGENILPEAGEIALGIDAMPVLQYFGNMQNGFAGANTPSFDFLTGMQAPNNIYVKYYLEDQTAVRLGIRLHKWTKTNRERVVQNQEIVDPLVKVIDTHKATNNFFDLSLDYLMYRGKGRVQGYFGGGIQFNYWTTKNTYTYGNPITTQYTSPAWYDFANDVATSGSERPLIGFANNNIAFGARGIIGVEYFLAPKISIGGEMGITIGAGLENGYNIVERWTGTEIEIEKVKTANDGQLGFKEFTTGSIFLMFHF